jgi:hypothetical protein
LNTRRYRADGRYLASSQFGGPGPRFFLPFQPLDRLLGLERLGSFAFRLDLVSLTAAGPLLESSAWK